MQSLLAASAFGELDAPFASLPWLSGLLTGPLGAGLAVIAVAWFGLAMLAGRLSLRSGGLLHKIPMPELRCQAA